jgi:hypothetical protein
MPENTLLAAVSAIPRVTRHTARGGEWAGSSLPTIPLPEVHVQLQGHCAGSLDMNRCLWRHHMRRATRETALPPKSSHARSRSESSHASSKSIFHCIVCPPGVHRGKFHATQQGVSVRQDRVQCPMLVERLPQLLRLRGLSTFRTFCPGQNGYCTDRMSPFTAHSRWLVQHFCGISVWHPFCPHVRGTGSRAVCIERGSV